MSGGDEALDAEGTEGATGKTRVGSLFPSKRTRNSLMTGERENDRRDDHVRVHAALKTVSQSRQSPVGDNSGDANFARLIGEDVGASDQVFDSDSVEKLDVRELESRSGVKSDKVEEARKVEKAIEISKVGSRRNEGRKAKECIS